MKLLRALRTPPVADRPFVAAGVGVWVGIAIAGHVMVGVGVLLAAAAMLVRWGRRRSSPWQLPAAIGVVACVVGLVVGVLDRVAIDAVHTAPLPSGVVDVVGTVRSDVSTERFGEAAVVDVHEIRGGDVITTPDAVTLVVRSDELDVVPGDTVVARRVEPRSRPGWHRTAPVTGTVQIDELEVVAGAVAPLHVEAGNAMRHRVLRALDERGTQAEALTRGFLIGDISSLGALEVEELRRAGLTHFVAVSGGNVALFLGGLWLLLIPVPLAPQIRAAVGLAALAVFVVMTRWEPSVIRAAGMAATVLVGKILGLPVDPWRALGGGVAAALVVAPRLAGSAGFRLSVAATAGLLLASHLGSGRRPRWVWRGLAASTSAQVAVFPLLIGYFGTVPLLAPLANVLAAPVVSAATIVAMFGVVTGSSIVMDGGVAIAGVVLRIARHAALGPQLGLASSLGVMALGASLFSRHVRVLGVAAAISVAAIGWARAPVASVAESVTVLDVGQGDAVLVRGTRGGVVAVDTGPDPAVYVAALRRAGVTHVDVLVVTHGDADHVGGAMGLLDRMSVGAIWLPRRQPPAPQVAELIDRAASMGVAVSVPRPGTRVGLGEVSVEVLGPGRRYDAENDESIVLWVAGPTRTMLLPGDIESVAQRELPPLRPDVLLVPHHGSATTDLEWLAETVQSMAVISVGPNSYGHPSIDVLEVLERSGARTLVTSRDGDIVVPLGDHRVSTDW